VYKVAVGAGCENLNTEFVEISLAGSDRCQFRWSNEGKVTGVKAEDGPLACIIRQADLFESTFIECHCCKIWSRFSNFCGAHCDLLRLLWCRFGATRIRWQRHRLDTGKLFFCQVSLLSWFAYQCIYIMYGLPANVKKNAKELDNENCPAPVLKME